MSPTDSDHDINQAPSSLPYDDSQCPVKTPLFQPKGLPAFPSVNSPLIAPASSVIPPSSQIQSDACGVHKPSASNVCTSSPKCPPSVPSPYSTHSSFYLPPTHFPPICALSPSSSQVNEQIDGDDDEDVNDDGECSSPPMSFVTSSSPGACPITPPLFASDPTAALECIASALNWHRDISPPEQHPPYPPPSLLPLPLSPYAAKSDSPSLSTPNSSPAFRSLEESDEPDDMSDGSNASNIRGRLSNTARRELLSAEKRSASIVVMPFGWRKYSCSGGELSQNRSDTSSRRFSGGCDSNFDHLRRKGLEEADQTKSMSPSGTSEELNSVNAGSYKFLTFASLSSTVDTTGTNESLRSVATSAANVAAATPFTLPAAFTSQASSSSENSCMTASADFKGSRIDDRTVNIGDSLQSFEKDSIGSEARSSAEKPLFTSTKTMIRGDMTKARSDIQSAMGSLGEGELDVVSTGERCEMSSVVPTGTERGGVGTTTADKVAVDSTGVEDRNRQNVIRENGVNIVTETMMKQKVDTDTCRPGGESLDLTAVSEDEIYGGSITTEKLETTSTPHTPGCSPERLRSDVMHWADYVSDGDDEEDEGEDEEGDNTTRGRGGVGDGAGFGTGGSRSQMGLFEEPWCAWYDKPKGRQGRLGVHEKDYEENLCQMGILKSTAEFWAIHDEVEWLSLPANCMISFSRVGIKPLWEDAGHRSGGRCVVKGIPRDQTEALFTKLSLCLMLGHFSDTSAITCLTVQIKEKRRGNNLQLWSKVVPTPSLSAELRSMVMFLLNDEGSTSESAVSVGSVANIDVQICLNSDAIERNTAKLDAAGRHLTKTGAALSCGAHNKSQHKSGGRKSRKSKGRSMASRCQQICELYLGHKGGGISTRAHADQKRQSLVTRGGAGVSERSQRRSRRGGKGRGHRRRPSSESQTTTSATRPPNGRAKKGGKIDWSDELVSNRPLRSGLHRHSLVDWTVSGPQRDASPDAGRDGKSDMNFDSVSSGANVENKILVNSKAEMGVIVSKNNTSLQGSGDVIEDELIVLPSSGGVGKSSLLNDTVTQVAATRDSSQNADYFSGTARSGGGTPRAPCVGSYILSTSHVTADVSSESLDVPTPLSARINRLKGDSRGDIRHELSGGWEVIEGRKLNSKFTEELSSPSMSQNSSAGCVDFVSEKEVGETGFIQDGGLSPTGEVSRAQRPPRQVPSNYHMPSQRMGGQLCVSDHRPSVPKSLNPVDSLSNFSHRQLNCCSTPLSNNHGNNHRYSISYSKGSKYNHSNYDNNGGGAYRHGNLTAVPNTNGDNYKFGGRRGGSGSGSGRGSRSANRRHWPQYQASEFHTDSKVDLPRDLSIRLNNKPQFNPSYPAAESQHHFQDGLVDVAVENDAISARERSRSQIRNLNKTTCVGSNKMSDGSYNVKFAGESQTGGSELFGDVSSSLMGNFSTTQVRGGTVQRSDWVSKSRPSLPGGFSDAVQSRAPGHEVGLSNLRSDNSELRTGFASMGSGPNVGLTGCGQSAAFGAQSTLRVTGDIHPVTFVCHPGAGSSDAAFIYHGNPNGCHQSIVHSQESRGLNIYPTDGASIVGSCPPAQVSPDQPAFSLDTRRFGLNAQNWESRNGVRTAESSGDEGRLLDEQSSGGSAATDAYYSNAPATAQIAPYFLMPCADGGQTLVPQFSSQQLPPQAYMTNSPTGGRAVILSPLMVHPSGALSNLPIAKNGLVVGSNNTYLDRAQTEPYTDKTGQKSFAKFNSKGGAKHSPFLGAYKPNALCEASTQRQTDGPCGVSTGAAERVNYNRGSIPSSDLYNYSGNHPHYYMQQQQQQQHHHQEGTVYPTQQQQQAPPAYLVGAYRNGCWYPSMDGLAAAL